MRRPRLSDITFGRMVALSLAVLAAELAALALVWEVHW